MKQVRIIAWILVLGLAVLMGARYFLAPNSGPATGTSTEDPSRNTPGGPFSLVNHFGEPVTDADFRGKYMMVYFGYSFCPDVCPMELQKMTSALGKLEAEGYSTDAIQPIFISVDPERDTPEALKDYVALFHPNLVGLTGTPEQIAEAARVYRVYYSKREAEDVEGYLMDHLSVIFLIRPDGSYDRIFTARDTPDSMAVALKPIVKG
ncbi:electron transporter SenC [Kordiimonas sediminis]|uniref:Electron transporter SenC n=1 Tax=Kordiimonas sediminis TaxID=1735581 RepID=A0A919ANR5_9PROT|nr:SCO family protein [Kordiimonas sediminis]GHF16165.1 electron transporter SenC [Kordiimonas sediminis]